MNRIMMEDLKASNATLAANTVLAESLCGPYYGCVREALKTPEDGPKALYSLPCFVSESDPG